MNKPQIELSENNACTRDKTAFKPLAVSRAKRSGKAKNVNVEPPENRGKGGRLKSFVVRALSAALILAFVFLPRFFPYNGSKTVTGAVKTVIMTDITGSDDVGNGKLVDFFRRLFAGNEEK